MLVCRKFKNVTAILYQLVVTNPGIRTGSGTLPELPSRPVPRGPRPRWGRRHDQDTVCGNQSNQLLNLRPGGKTEGARGRSEAPKKTLETQSSPPRQAEEHPQSPSQRHNQDISRSPSPRPLGRRPPLEREQLVDAGRRDHDPRVKNEDPLETGTRETTNGHIAQGSLRANRATVTATTSDLRLARPNGVTRTTPAVPCHKLSWRLPFLRAWRSLPT
ncbi:unnamed protein product [Vicia faba]|uniref:Uncharacterized protein n=1 Tax=Vicia faba TaxID=3906 RepID=A0AAV1AED2_VICFA|nr:unnamed protein product [Vicia faba]